MLEEVDSVDYFVNLLVKVVQIMKEHVSDFAAFLCLRKGRGGVSPVFSGLVGVEFLLVQVVERYLD